MRFNLIFNFHKNPDWKNFYLEYSELRDYLKQARDFFNKEVEIHIKKYPNNENLRRIAEEQKEPQQQEPEELNNGVNNHEQEICLKKKSYNLPDLEKKYTSKQFSKNFIEKFKTKLKIVEEFFVQAKNDLNADFENLKQLVLQCEGLERFSHENIISNLRSIKHDYKWRQSSKGDELTCRYAFIHLYNLALLLESYRTVNKVAAEKIITKYKKYFPEDPQIKEIDNILKEFDTHLSFQDEITNKILDFFAEQFFRGNRDQAKKELERTSGLQPKYTYVVYVLLIIAVLLLVGFLLLLYLSENTKRIDQLHTYFPAYSFVLMIIVFFLYIPIMIIMFKKYGINYVYLLELDPELLYAPNTYFIHFLVLLILWEILLIIYAVGLLYYYPIFKGKLFILPVILLCIYFIYFFWPFYGLFKELRICLLIVFVKLILPITKKGVKFRDFMMGDIVLSFAIAFANLTVAMCLIYCDECRQVDEQYDCHKNHAVPVFLAFPAVIRMVQCANLIYYGQRRVIEIINFFKYAFHASDLILGWLYLVKIVELNIFIIFVTISSTYLLLFDMIIDWNLLHIRSKNLFLRDKILYPKFFYYYALITNGFLRYFWFFGLVVQPLSRDWILLITNFLEIYRRAQWCLIRMENEQSYNIEGYRQFLPVPQLVEH